MRTTLSPSSIGLFLECPRCFWLELVQGVRRPAAIFPSLPGGMDRILKQHFDTHRGQLPPELAGKVEGRLFPDATKLSVFRDNRKGLRWKSPSGFELMGAIDDLFVTPDSRYAPLDVKTRGSAPKEETVSYYQHQMDIYSFLLEKNSLPPAGFALLVFYHPESVVSEGLLKFHIDIRQVPVNPGQGEEHFQQAVRCLQGPEPPKAGCVWCNLIG